LRASFPYTVLEGKQLFNRDGSEGPKLIKIRDPFGWSKYNKPNGGPWGDFNFKQGKWTTAYLKQTGFTKTSIKYVMD
jgi:hypothetical protein